MWVRQAARQGTCQGISVDGLLAVIRLTKSRMMMTLAKSC
jgi:hypothetical protein